VSKTTNREYPSRKKLEILIQKLIYPKEYNNDLEQYMTDPHVASMLVYIAFQSGDIEGKTVADLGCGNGILAFGAAIMGARHVYAMDSDVSMAALCKENCKGLPVTVEASDIITYSKKVDTVLMNPPFGSVRKHADLPFIMAAATHSSTIYSIHNMKTRAFIEKEYNNIGDIFFQAKVLISVPRIYAHHKDNARDLEALIIGLRVKDPANKPN
jgi:putative methylase